MQKRSPLMVHVSIVQVCEYNIVRFCLTLTHSLEQETG